jgi:MFS family permease
VRGPYCISHRSVSKTWQPIHFNTVAYIRFFLTHPRMLSFGILLTLFSSFGQTFLISMFVPRLLDTFTLDTAQFGLLYAAATVTSALSLPFFGRLIDRAPLRGFSLAVGLGLVFACFLMALAPNVPMLFLAILGLRLTGQGLLSLTASTTMARVFEEGRGKALSLSGLGYPLGEGLLPLLVVLLIHAAGWRLSWGILGVVIAVLLLPAMYSLLADVEKHRPTPPTAGTAGSARSRVRLLRDRRFYLLLPGSLYVPLVLTALFLYQVPLAEHRGWSTHTMAAAFIGFAVARSVASLIAGPMIDRWSAVRFFPLILIPVSLGLVILSVGVVPWIAFVYLILAGVSQGIASPMMTALWAEVFGVESLGAIKGTVSTFGILSTAAGPVLLGALLKAGISFDWIIPVTAGLGFVTAGLSLVARRYLAQHPG